MVVKLHHIYFPEDLVGGSVLDSNWQVTSVVETSKFRSRNGTSFNCTSDRGLDNWLRFWLVKRERFASDTCSFLKSSFSVGCNTLLSFFDWGETHLLLAVEFTHSFLAKVTENGVLSTRKQLVVRLSPCTLAVIGEGKDFFEVVFNNH